MKPNNYPLVKVSEFADVITGGTPSTTKKEYWENGTIPWLNSGALNEKIITNSKNFITHEGLKNSSAKMMPLDTVLIALTGATTGVTALLKMEACANQSVTGILPSKKHIPLYLFYYVSSIREKIMAGSYGGAQKHISQGYVKDLEIPLPPLAEQKRIATILEKANEIKAKRELALAKLDKLADSTFIEMFGDPLKNSMNWKASKLKDITVFENGDRSSNYPSGDEVIDSGVLFLSTKNIVKNKLNLNFSQYISDLKFASLSRGKAVNNDLIITLRGTLGSCCIFDKDRAFINAQMMIIRCKNEVVTQYLHSLLTSKSMHRHLQEIGNGAAVKQLTASQLGDLLIPVPPISIQAKFKERLATIHSLKEVTLNAQNKYLRLVSSLQNQAFTTGFNS